jgi:hypothetical protein
MRDCLRCLYVPISSHVRPPHSGTIRSSQPPLRGLTGRLPKAILRCPLGEPTMSDGVREPRPAWEKFAHALLATTCLSLGGGAASAATITESTPPAPSDFPNSFPGYLLPVGTTQVFGSISPGGDQDWFGFQGLQAGQTFSLLGKYNPEGQESGTRFFTYNTGSVLIGSGNAGPGEATLEGGGFSVTGTIPGNGEIIVEIASEGTSNYEMDLTAPLAESTAPEPGTFITTGLAIAGALAWRRKRIARS